MDELIRQFGINEKLLFAHAVNFFILFFLLKRFAYRPVLHIFAERRKKIREGLDASEEAKRRLNTTEQMSLKIIADGQKEACAIVTRAEAIGKEKGETLLQKAVEKSEEIIQTGKQRIEEEQKSAAEEFSKKAVEIVRAASAAVIARSPENIDKELVKTALQELGSFGVRIQP